MSPLEKFGQFIIHSFRDRAFEQHLLMQKGHWKSPAIQELQHAVMNLPDETKQLVMRVVIDVIDTALHDFLFAIQDANDRDLDIKILVDGENVAEKSGMLQGEHLGEDGWISKYSKYPEFRK